MEQCILFPESELDLARYNPTPEQIESLTLEIRLGWDDATERSRRTVQRDEWTVRRCRAACSEPMEE
jgi:hypothetical protein